tara:strand:+ start:527 stop:1375 length:849 start_codon:yes stop_codon:yes gene_type:complete
MKFKLIKSYAKVNLSLKVIGKLKSGLHKIESLVSFLDLHDEIYIKKIKKKKHNIIFYGKFSNGISKENTIYKLLKIIDSHKLLKGKKYFIKIKKNIPQKSGMGGGSMNAATLIKYFLSKNIIKLSKNKIIEISNLVGSDVKLGIELKNTILLSNQALLRMEKKIPFFCLVVKPNFGCSTKDIYGKIKLFSKSQLTKNTKNILNINNIKSFDNDLEAIVLRKYPKLKKLKLFIQDLPRVKIVRMTGSGSSIIAYFETRNNSLNAARIFRKKYKNYWCILSKTI